MKKLLSSLFIISILAQPVEAKGLGLILKPFRAVFNFLRKEIIIESCPLSEYRPFVNAE